jgi:hypothetical protein
MRQLFDPKIVFARQPVDQRRSLRLIKFPQRTGPAIAVFNR